MASLSPTKDTKFFLDNGIHTHRLYDGRRQDGLLELLQDRLQVLREASTIKRRSSNSNDSNKDIQKDILDSLPIIQLKPVSHSPLQSSSPPTILSSDLGSTHQTTSLIHRYGTNKQQIGRGSSGVVSVTFRPHSVNTVGQLFAVKKFSQRERDSVKKHLKRIGAEFCISSALHHVNVIETLDLVQDTDGTFCQIMEYCSGGDVFSRVRAQGRLCAAEADCYFKQLVRGMEYLHATGVVHRDIKPDNLLLTCRGCLKIADFGSAECVRLPWEESVRLSSGLCGSFPYISPEQYSSSLDYLDGRSSSVYRFDGRAADVWAAGVVYMDMRMGRHMWRFAVVERDEYFEDYVRSRREYGVWEPIEMLDVSLPLLTSGRDHI
jgi:protein-serine/threonine kinase